MHLIIAQVKKLKSRVVRQHGPDGWSIIRRQIVIPEVQLLQQGIIFQRRRQNKQGSPREKDALQMQHFQVWVSLQTPSKGGHCHLCEDGAPCIQVGETRGFT